MNRRAFLALPFLGVPGCAKRESRVVVYCAQDREFAEGLFADFARETGISVSPKFDTEANKSVALAAELEQEAARPRCDLHWNNEPLGSARLHRKGIYAAAPHHFAARARVLIVNTNLVKDADRPRGLFDLAEPPWRGKAAMAKPFFGTTATHAACLFATMGAVGARALFEKLKANGLNIVAVNKQVAVDVAAGRFAAGTTDTDDALIEILGGKPVAMIQADEKLGTLFLPNTLAVVKTGPNPVAAQKLLEYLSRPETEKRLAEGGGFQIPMNPDVTANLPPGLLRPSQVEPMAVDFARAADAWDETQKVLRELFA